MSGLLILLGVAWGAALASYGIYRGWTTRRLMTFFAPLYVAWVGVLALVLLV